MNTKSMALYIRQSGKLIATFLLPSGVALAAEEWANPVNLSCSYHLPNWVLALGLTASVVVIIWFALRIMGGRRPFMAKTTNRCLACYATLTSATLGAVLSAILVDMKEDQLLISEINALPPTAAGGVTTTYSKNPRLAAAAQMQQNYTESQERIASSSHKPYIQEQLDQEYEQAAAAGWGAPH